MMIGHDEVYLSLKNFVRSLSFNHHDTVLLRIKIPNTEKIKMKRDFEIFSANNGKLSCKIILKFKIFFGLPKFFSP